MQKDINTINKRLGFAGFKGCFEKRGRSSSF